MGSLIVGVLSVISISIPFILLYNIDSNVALTSAEKVWGGGFTLMMLSLFSWVPPFLSVVGFILGIIEFINGKNKDKALIGIILNLIVAGIVLFLEVRHQQIENTERPDPYSNPMEHKI